jgi:DNA-binding beta-propeller fold protein YncE
MAVSPASTRWKIYLGLFSAALVILAVAAIAGSRPTAVESAPAMDFEIWAMDQGTHLIHVFDPEFNELDRIDMAAHGARVPHMIHFTSDHAYALVANPATGNVAVIRAADRAVVDVLATGPRTHAATVAPGDRTALVAVIGAADTPWDGKVVELELDLANERFTLGRELMVAEDPLFAPRRDEFVETGGAVCMDFDATGRHAYISLGPLLHEGGLVVLDTETFQLVRVFSPLEADANCGTLLSPTGEHVFANAGDAEVGAWLALETGSHDIVHRGDSGGHDAHGAWLTPDGRELWMVNRVTSDAIIIDPGTFDVIDRIDFVGKTPDILAMSPDGRFAYATLRGPNPVTMPHVAVGETPGVAVLDVASRSLVRIVEPAAGDDASDFHGIAVRPLTR